jgi:hypothetical protein
MTDITISQENTKKIIELSKDCCFISKIGMLDLDEFARTSARQLRIGIIPLLQANKVKNECFK